MLEDNEILESTANNSISALTEFQDIFSDLRDKARQIKEDNQNITHELFISLAKLDHLVYKMDGYSSILKGKIIAEFEDHHNCRFGKWFENEGKKLFGDMPDYKKVEKPHAQVHNEVKKAIEYIKTQSCTQNAQSIIENFKTAERSSKELFEILDQILSEKKAKH